MKHLLLVLSLALSSPAFAYFGYQSSEARLTFDAFAEITTKTKPTPAQQQEIVANHFDFLFGDLSLSETPGGPKNDGQGTITKIEAIKHGYRIYYSYEGTVVLKAGARTHITVDLPNNPHQMFLKFKKTLKCGDTDYMDEADFSYFWSPNQPGCDKVITPGDDYQVIDAKIERLSNTDHTRPNFERLPDGNGDIHISLLMGLDDEDNIHNPMESEHTKHDDINAGNFRKIRKHLMRDLGFESEGAWSNEQIREVVQKNVRELPYVEDFTQAYNGNRARKITVTMFFGLTDLKQNSWAFDYFYKRAVENSAVIIFDGHTGMGTNLTLPILEKKMDTTFNVPADRYQLMYIDSCSSYGYYNLDFFKRKDRRDLNVITAGLETPFDGGVRTDVALIESVHNWAARGTMVGFKTLMKRLENDNMAGVNGDEENPTTSN